MYQETIKTRPQIELLYSHIVTVCYKLLACSLAEAKKIRAERKQARKKAEGGKEKWQ